MKADAEVLMESVRGQLISLDGKKMRGVSPKSRGNKGLYILSAWMSEQQRRKLFVNYLFRRGLHVQI